MAFIKDAPNPNATKVFVNWFLTKKPQTIFAQKTDWQSTRLDVPTDFITPERIRQPGVDYIMVETEEFQEKKEKYEELAREIFGPLLR